MSENRSIIRLGSNLHYWISGPENGLLVALVHGATLDHHSFEAQVFPLTEAGYRVLTLDLRGHGESTPIGEGIDLGILAADLRAVMDQLGADRIVPVGHSFGGYVAQEFTRRYPERVSALAVLGCTNLAKKSSAASRLLYRVFPAILSKMSLDTFRKRTLAELSIHQAVKDYAAQAMNGISREDFVAIILAGIAALWLDSGFGPNYIIPRPFLLTHGAQDSANGDAVRRSAPTWTAREPNCRYEVIPDAGHAAHMDNPAAFNSVLLDFLQSNIK